MLARRRGPCPGPGSAVDRTRRRILHALPAALLFAAALLLGACGRSASRNQVVASDLANPRQMTFAADGALYVAEAGSGGGTRCVKDPAGGAPLCLGATGAVVRIAGGREQGVLAGLPSVAVAAGTEASGPADVIVDGGRLVLVTQDTQIDASGANQFGAAGNLLGRMLSAPLGGGSLRRGADLAAFEAVDDPDGGAGAPAGQALDSDPYSLTAYRGGYVVADAAGNDLLGVDARGRVRVVAVFPIGHETAPAGTVAARARRVAVQAVPTSVAVGPDGALYVSELSGYPFDPGTARIWRVVPGRRPSVYASGLTNVSALAFDQRGRLLVLEIDAAGLRDPRASGALLRLDGPSRRTVLVSRGLPAATGLAVSPAGAIYVAIEGTSPTHGAIVRVA